PALRPLAGPGVGVGALAADRQTLPVAQAAIAAEVHEPLDVHGDLTAEIALDLVVGLDDLADGAGLLLGEVLGPGGQGDARLGHDVLGGLVADPVDVLEGDHHPLGGGKVDAGDASHAGSGSSFPGRALSPAAACDAGSPRRSPGRPASCGSPCTCRKSSSLTRGPSWRHRLLVERHILPAAPEKARS